MNVTEAQIRDVIRQLIVKAEATRDSVAKKCGFSPWYMSRKCRDCFGLSIKQMVDDERAKIAWLLIYHGEDYTKAAKAIGFAHHSSLSRFMRNQGQGRISKIRK